MLIKPGVDISRLCRECRRLLNVLEDAYPNFVVTSTYEGTHMPASLHYANQAFDIRLAYPARWREIDPNRVDKLAGPGFDVLRSHKCIHIEWDPKK